MNVGISYEVYNLKSFTDLDYEKIIDCQDWRLGRLSVGAWNFGSHNVWLCNVSICHWNVIDSLKTKITTELQRCIGLIPKHYSCVFIF